jgi:hypothetical protein
MILYPKTTKEYDGGILYCDTVTVLHAVTNVSNQQLMQT